MKKLLVALTTTGLLTFGAVAQAAGDAAAGKATFQSTCVGCHGASAEGGVGPKLAGRKAAYIVEKLQAYKAGKQIGPMTSMMAPMAGGLTDAQMNNIGTYLSTL